MISRSTTSSTGKKPVIVLFQGSFDVINWGHIKCFEMAKKEGDILIVALNSNALVRKYKRFPAVLPWKQKKFIIASCRFVDKVIRATEFSPLNLLRKYKVDVYVIAEEWRDTKAEEIAYMESIGGRVVYTPRFNGVVSSGDIKKAYLAGKVLEEGDIIGSN